MLPVFPTAYFGSIAWFQQLVQYERVAIEVWDTFPKQTFRNRCTFPGPAGDLRLTIPVVKPQGSKTLTKDILISDQVNWRMQHWRTIQSAYGSAPYFEHYEQEIKDLLFSSFGELAYFNNHLSLWFLKQFSLTVELNFTSDYSRQIPDNSNYREVDFESESCMLYLSKPYQQVYFQSIEFHPNQSILDALFCLGPMGRNLLLIK